MRGRTQRRRRECLSCGKRWATYEITLPDHMDGVRAGEAVRQALLVALSIISAVDLNYDVAHNAGGPAHMKQPAKDSEAEQVTL